VGDDAFHAKVSVITADSDDLNHLRSPWDGCAYLEATAFRGEPSLTA
jgi:hypothetical protein